MRMQLPEMSDAPTAATVEASMKFLDRVIKGEFAMKTSVATTSSQVKQLFNKGIDAVALAECHAEALVGILGAIARISQDDTIVKLAAHGKNVASTLLDDVQYSREEIEAAGLGV